MSVYNLIHIIQKWDIENRRFIVDEESDLFVTFGPADVKMVYGLPTEGSDVSGVRSSRSDVNSLKSFCAKYKIKVSDRRPAVVGQHVYNALIGNRALRNNVEDFLMLYVFFAIWRVLAPTSGPEISLKTLALLSGPLFGKQYAWSNYIYTKIVESLDHAKSHFLDVEKWKFLRFTGDLHCLMVNIFYFYTVI